MTSGLPVRRFLLSVTALAVGFASAGVLAPGPAAAAGLPDLRMTITTTPDKASYAVGDAVTTVFTVVNAGTVAAVGAHIDGGDEEGIDRAAGGVPRDPFDLAAGASHSFTWAGTINHNAFLGGAAHGVWTITNDAGEASPADNIARYRIAVPGAVGDISVKAFVDVKGNQDSSQPGQGGVTVDVTDSTGKKVASASTDSTGQVRFKALPAGTYVLTPVDWQLEGDKPASTDVRGDGTADVGLALLPKHGTASPSVSATATSPAGVPTQPSPSASTTGALAITGSSSGPTFLAGAAVLVLGAVALIAARRRRRRFVVPE